MINLLKRGKNRKFDTFNQNDKNNTFRYLQESDCNTLNFNKLTQEGKDKNFCWLEISDRNTKNFDKLSQEGQHENYKFLKEYYQKYVSISNQKLGNLLKESDNFIEKMVPLEEKSNFIVNKILAIKKSRENRIPVVQSNDNTKFLSKKTKGEKIIYLDIY